MPVNIKNPELKIDNRALDDAETKLGQHFPPEYKEFLLRNNGGKPVPASFDITWDNNQLEEDWRSSKVDWFLSIYDGQYANLIEYNCVDYLGRIPANTIAIAHDPGGNLILMGVGSDNNGQIYFWVKDHEVEEGEVPGYDNVGFIANSLPEFLDSLR